MIRLGIVLAAFAASCVALPAQAQICAPFNDVPASDGFCSSIQWMYNRAITVGCTAPPGQTWYCPTQFVRRDQMAAFMFRLGNVVFQQGGNAFGTTARLGTTDGEALELRVGGNRAMRYEYFLETANVIGGDVQNQVVGNVRGGSIGGGGGTGGPNIVTDDHGTVAGGSGNRAGNANGNPSDAWNATVGGGSFNVADGSYSTVPGGFSNVATGSASFVAGGFSNFALGIAGFAAGSFARSDGNRCAVFSLWGEAPGMPCFGLSGIFLIGAPQGFAIDYFSQRADGGGTRFVGIGRVPGQTIATWTGAFLSDAGVWVNAASSRDVKTDFAPVDTEGILDKVAALPITTWRYREGEGTVRHIGPMAEDFAVAFDVGYGPHTIADLDARGVALAAIQGLNAKLDKTIGEHASALAQRDARLQAQQLEIAELKAAVASLFARGSSIAPPLR